MAAYAANTTNLSTHLLTAQKNKSHTKESTFWEKDVRVKEVRRMGQNKSRKGYMTERVTGLAEEQERRYIKKWDQTNSFEIPDRGETSESLASLQWFLICSCSAKTPHKKTLCPDITSVFDRVFKIKYLSTTYLPVPD